MPTQAHRSEASRPGLALIVLLTMVAGCDRTAPAAPPSPAAAAAPAPSSPPPKPTYTLILTWMYSAQPPQTTQTVFRDEVACDQARDAAIAEGRRLALESIGDTPAAAAPKPATPAPRRYIGSALLPSDETSPPTPASAPQATPPKVAAICAATSTP